MYSLPPIGTAVTIQTAIQVDLVDNYADRIVLH